MIPRLKRNDMIQQEKIQVRDALVRYLQQFPSAAIAAQSLQGIDADALSKVEKNEWETVTDECWQALAKQVGFYCGDWQAADTSTYMLLRILFADAKHYAMIYGICMSDGLGKTFAAKSYMRGNPGTIYIAAHESYNRKTFMGDMLRSFDADANGTVPAMMQQLSNKICMADEPLLIIDDAQKLKDRVFHFLLSMVDCLKHLCGIVIMGNDKLRTRVAKGVDENKEEYKSVFNNIGRRFITLSQPGPDDVALICKANSVEDPQSIAYIKENCNNNMHLVSQLLQQAKERQAA